MSAIVEPSTAAVSTSRSRSVSGFGPADNAAAASAGSTTRSPREHPPDRVRQLLDRAVLDEEAARARLHRPAQVPGPAERGQDQHVAALAGQRRSAPAASSPDAPGISMSSSAMSGLVIQRGRRRPRRRRDFRDHLDVGFEAEQQRQRAAHHALVLGEQYRITRRPPGMLRCPVHAGRIGIGTVTVSRNPPPGAVELVTRAARVGDPLPQPEQAGAAGRARRLRRPDRRRRSPSRSRLSVGQPIRVIRHRLAWAVPDHVRRAPPGPPSRTARSSPAATRHRPVCQITHAIPASTSAARRRRVRSSNRRPAIPVDRVAYLGQRLPADRLDVGGLARGGGRIAFGQPADHLGLHDDQRQRVARAGRAGPGRTAAAPRETAVRASSAGSRAASAM